MSIITVSATPEKIRVTHYDVTKCVRFKDPHTKARRSVRQVAIRWAELTGSSEALASAAWRRCAFGPMPAPSRLTEADWADVLQSIDSEIGALVNDPNSRFYIYG